MLSASPLTWSHCAIKIAANWQENTHEHATVKNW